MELWSKLYRQFGTFCVWSIFRIFEHDEDKSQFPRKNQVGDITTSSLKYVVEES